MKKLLFILPLLIWVACEDDKELDCAGVEDGDNICGCTDVSALNYDSEATFDDGSCDYFVWTVTDEHRAFADENWSLMNWVYNTLSNPIGDYEGVGIIGEYELVINCTGNAAQVLGATTISSDSLLEYSHLAFSGDCSPAKTDSFYYYIGLHNQFVGGWDDCYSYSSSVGEYIPLWYEVDTTYRDGTSETIIMTPMKQYYLSF